MGKAFIAIIFVFCCYSVGLVAEPPANADGLVLFSKTFENFAWGHQYYGIFVDSNGDVFSFDYARSKDSPSLPKEKWSNADLRKKFEPMQKHIKTIKLDELNKMIALIPSIEAASTSRPLVQDGCDMGTSLWTAYHWNPAGDDYKPVRLKQAGDFSCQNLATATKILIEWLNSMEKP